MLGNTEWYAFILPYLPTQRILWHGSSKIRQEMTQPIPLPKCRINNVSLIFHRLLPNLHFKTASNAGWTNFLNQPFIIPSLPYEIFFPSI